MAASAGFGNRLAAQQGYGRTALGTLALARSSGVYRSSRAPSRCTPRRRLRSGWGLYVLGAAAALVALLLGTIAALYVLRALP